MLTKKNIFSVQNYLRGNIDLWQFANDKQNVDVAPRWKKLCGRPWWSSFLAFVFSLLSCFTTLRITCFFPFSYSFGCKIKRINRFLLLFHQNYLHQQMLCTNYYGCCRLLQTTI